MVKRRPKIKIPKDIDYDTMYEGRPALERPIQDTHPNQWTGTKQQEEFLERWLSPKSPTFGNPYTSAMEAGYSETYSRIIAADSVGNDWIKRAHNLVAFKPEHVVQKLQEIATDGDERTADQLKALELIGKAQGMFVDRKVIGHVNIENALKDLE